MYFRARYEIKTTYYTYIDLFAGAGGLSIGFGNHGFHLSNGK